MSAEREALEAARKLANACIFWGDKESVCAICQRIGENDDAPKHRRDCLVAKFRAADRAAQTETREDGNGR